MAVQIVGKKAGMTRLHLEGGKSIAVTVISVPETVVVDTKNTKRDGYDAVRLAVGDVKESRLNKPQLGVFKKNDVAPKKKIYEWRKDNCEEHEAAQVLSLEMFQEVTKVHVTGTSKGKGFAGTVKRWNFKTQDNSHGNSISHRVPGSIGNRKSPSRVFKGKKMSGHMGAERVTTRNLELVKIDLEHSLMLIKGSIPGAPGNWVKVVATP